MARIYSTYEAKARLSEILRKVRAGQRVGISHRGQLVAEVGPASPVPVALRKRLERLTAEGCVSPAPEPRPQFVRVARRPGALKRFLESRD